MNEPLIQDLLSQPFPARGAVTALRDRVVVALQRHAPSPGTAFLTDGELVEQSGLSRSTVRRALVGLQREGWLSREAGRGTFIGPRVAAGGPTVERRASQRPARLSPQGRADASGKTGRYGQELQGQLGVTHARQGIRLGVVMFDIGGLSNDWLTPGVLAGIDDAADGAGVAVELLGLRERDSESLGRRLERTRPDVLVSLAAQPRDALLLRDAVRLGIPAMVVGSAHQFLGFPAIVEDNRLGAEAAVDLLHEAGHRRIGLVVNRWPAAWVFLRQEAFQQRLADHGLVTQAEGAAGQTTIGPSLPVEAMTCWIGSGGHPGFHDQRLHADGSPLRSRRVAPPGGTGGTQDVPETPPFAGAVEAVMAWLERTEPTAVVCGSYVGTETLAAAAVRLGLRIPQDLSVVAMDQHPDAARWLGVEPTLLALPLGTMGRQAALASRAMAERAELPDVTLVPFELRPGRSVKRLAGSSTEAVGPATPSIGPSTQPSTDR